MNKKTVVSIVSSTVLSLVVISGVAYAATSPAASDTSLLHKGTIEVDSLKVGKQDVGGVTYFNGTVINETQNSGVDNPVTIGDDLRVDGRVFRGASAGSATGGAAMPFVINDDLETTGTATFNNDIVVRGSIKNEDGTVLVGGTKNLAIPGSAFIESSLEGISKYPLRVSGVLIPSPLTNFSAPVYLPDGAKIIKVTMRVKDNDATVGENIRLNLDRFRNTTAGTQSEGITSLSSTDALTKDVFQEFSSTNVYNTTVDNAQYSYVVNIYNASDVTYTSATLFATAIDSVHIEYLLP